MSCKVKWGDCLSEEFAVPLGTKQGGIISPKLFSLYIDDLIPILKKHGVGCHFLNMFVACILFADDMVLLAPRRSALQQMINVCRDFCDRFCLSFNVHKSKVMVFGKRNSFNVLPLTLNDSPIDFVEE